MNSTNVTNSGRMDVSGIIGNSNVLHQGTPAHRREEIGCDVGVLTIITRETEAVNRVFALKPPGVSIVSAQAPAQGVEPAASTTGTLLSRHRPGVVVLTGIGGSIDEGAQVGDVVVATEVIGYDLRKETPEGTQMRGRMWTAPQSTVTAVQAFFVEQVLRGAFREFQVLSGPIGSGNAVVADANSVIRANLKQFNDKVLAVDMESAGLAQCCYAHDGHPWVVVRGISDKANLIKDDAHHAVAAERAALVARELIPYLAK